MIKPKRSAEQQVADELERRALHPLSSRQTISDSQAEPEFHANHKRLRAERLAREAVEIGLEGEAKRLIYPLSGARTPTDLLSTATCGWIKPGLGRSCERQLFLRCL
jgi:hypothetical protein